MFGLFKKSEPAHTSGHFSADAAQILKALGGAENIENVTACITRLRVTLHDFSHVDHNALKELGAADAVKVGSTLQAIFGTKSAEYAAELQKLLAK